MLRKLILRRQSPFQLIFSMFGAVCGMLLLLISVQVWQDFNLILNNPEDDLLSDDFMVVNKKVSVATTSSFFKPGFAEYEIEDLSALSAVERVGPFTANRFQVQLFVEAGNPDFPPLRTDLFFESIPDGFIDADEQEFNWQQGDSLIPMIMSGDYLALYNFGFAPTRGYPRISKKMLEALPFNFRIRGQGKDDNWQGRIVGFSDRINTFLVPQSFMEHANVEYGAGEEQNPSRVVLQVKDPSDPTLFQYFEESGYITNRDKIKNSKLSGAFRMTITALSVLGGLIFLLTVISFVQYSQIIIGRSEYQIRVLLNIGYDYRSIIGYYLRFFGLMFVGIGLIVLTVVLLAHGSYSDWIMENGFDVSGSVAEKTWLAGFGFLLLYLIISAWNIFRQVKRIAKPDHN